MARAELPAEVDESLSRKLDDVADGYTDSEQALIERYLRDAAARMTAYAREGLPGSVQHG